MARTGVKCNTAGCHRRRKMDAQERARLRAEGEQYGVRAGIMCPACVEAAMVDEAHFAVDMSLGEMLVQATRADAPWRIVLVPDPAAKTEPEFEEESCHS